MGVSESGPGAAPTAAPVPEPPVVAATWQERDPGEPWCPPALVAHLPWADDVATAHARTWGGEGGAAWTMLAGTRRGRSHAHQAQWREDAATLSQLIGPDGHPLYLLVAADGAGSARWSRVGSEAACRAVLAFCRAHEAIADNPGPMLVAAASAAVDELLHLARAGGGEGRDLRTTLLVAALWGPAGAERLACTQVGDGAVLVRTADGAVTQLGTGDSGEFSGEVTCFVPDDGARERAAAALVEREARDVTHLVLLTDGIEDPFYPIARRGPVLMAQLMDGVREPAEHFQKQAVHGPVFGSAQRHEHLAQWLAFERRGENDDRTIVAAVRAPHAGG